MIVLNTTLFSILLFIACGIIWRLTIIKDDGAFRKIMIGYFSTDAFVLIGLLVLESVWKLSTTTQVFLFVLFLPKTIAKIIFYKYINNK